MGMGKSSKVACSLSLLFLFFLIFPVGGLIAFDWIPYEFAIDLDYVDYHTDHFWNKHGEVKPAHNDFKLKGGRVWLEYAPCWTDYFFVRGDYDRIEESLEGNSNGFEDVEVSWAHYLTRLGNGSLWTKLLTVVPAGKEKHSLRYGRFGVEGGLIYSSECCFWGRQLWYSAELGYRGYSGFPSDQVRANADLYYSLTERLHFLGRARLEYGVFNGKRHEDFNQILFNPNYRLLKIEGRLIACLYKGFYINAGYLLHVWGENVGNGGAFVGGCGFVF
jgi:hypothetical protein